MKKILLICLFIFIVSCKDGSDDSTIPGDFNTTTPPILTNPNPGPVPTPIPIPEPTLDPTWTEQFYELINNHRRSLGLRELLTATGLDQIATTHSVNMATGVVPVGHSGMDQRCDEGRDYLGGGNWCGENVAQGQKTPQDAFNWWKNSQVHRENMELPRYTHMGFGYKKSSTDRYYWTLILWEH